VSDAPAAVELRGIGLRRGRGADGFALEIDSLRIRQGECVALTGPSGSGKSTLLDLLGLVLRPERMETFLLRDAQGGLADIGALWRARDRDALAAIRASSIGYVLQTGGLLPFLPARENILLSRSLLGLPEDHLAQRLAERLRVAHLLSKKPGALSVGERQRVAIARALAHRPTLMLADEPTAALDPIHAVEVMELMLELAAELGATAVVVTHDWDLARSLGLREIPAEPLQRGEGCATRFAG